MSISARILNFSLLKPFDPLANSQVKPRCLSANILRKHALTFGEDVMASTDPVNVPKSTGSNASDGASSRYC